jgi:predicted O-methyltransferase YrrM
MIDTDNLNLPSVLHGITATTEALELTMAADLQLGSLLRTLAAAKPDGRFLELETASGVATAWLLDGMTPGSTLLSIDSDAENTRFAKRFLGGDTRLDLQTGEARQLLQELARHDLRPDLIRATAQQGPALLADAAGLLATGGLMVVSGLARHDRTPDSEAEQLRAVTDSLERSALLRVTRLDWSSGIILAARLPG